jgi:hypothetical protein
MSELPYANRLVRVGVQLQPQHADYADLRRAVSAADEAGVDVIFTWDHFFPVRGDPEGKHFECWTMLAVRLAAEYANIWHGFGDVETLARMNHI